MKCENPAAVSRRRIDRRRIRDRVNRGDEEQQAYRTDSPFMFQVVVLDVAKAVPFHAFATRTKSILTFRKGDCSTLAPVNLFDVAAGETVSNKVVTETEVLAAHGAGRRGSAQYRSNYSVL